MQFYGQTFHLTLRILLKANAFKNEILDVNTRTRIISEVLHYDHDEALAYFKGKNPNHQQIATHFRSRLGL